MSYRFTLNSAFARQRAATVIANAPDGYVVSVDEPKRTLDQNSRLWALLSDVAMSKPQGRMHTPEEWKCIFMSACGWEVAFLPGLDGRFLPYGYRSSKLTKKQMATLQDFIEAWGSENDVRWSAPASVDRSPKGHDNEDWHGAKHESAVGEAETPVTNRLSQGG